MFSKIMQDESICKQVVELLLNVKYDEFKQEGIAIGEARGEKRGMQQKAYETARIALQNNIPLEMIQKLTSLSKEEILALNLHNH